MPNHKIPMKRKKIKEFFGGCSYCNKMSDFLRECRYRIDLHKWQKEKVNLCPECRKYLIGNFKYS